MPLRNEKKSLWCRFQVVLPSCTRHYMSVDTHVLSNRGWGCPCFIQGGRDTMFASQYMQQLRIQRSLKAPLRSYHLFVGEPKTVNWLLKSTVVAFQICRFCWHRIRTDENGLCPACRKVSTIFVLYFAQEFFKEFSKSFLFQEYFLQSFTWCFIV